MLTTPFYLPILALVVNLTFVGLWIREKNKNRKLRSFNTDVVEKLIKSRQEWLAAKKELTFIRETVRKELELAKTDGKAHSWAGRLARMRVKTLNDVEAILYRKGEGAGK